jgi:kynurenine formamidase
MRIYDLTRVIEEGMPVYPGDPEVRFRLHSGYPEHGYRVTGLELGTHAGTHLDAPAHFLPEGATVEALPLSALVGPARVVSQHGGTPEVRRGERLLLRSGWSARWGSEGYFDQFPPLPRVLAEQLAAAPAALVGLETPSLHPDGEEDGLLHRLLLGAGVAILENLTGLERLPERVFLAALPLPLRGLDGAPCRVVALDGSMGIEGLAAGIMEKEGTR